MHRGKLERVTTELPETREEREQFSAAYRRYRWREAVVLGGALVCAFIAFVVGSPELAFRAGLGIAGLGFVAIGVDSWYHREMYRTLFEYIDWAGAGGRSPAVSTDRDSMARRHAVVYPVIGVLVALIGLVFPLGA
jgi:hypothetical protein